jgi:hypothetical protein
MTVRIKWNHSIGDPISVLRGTRQGGLSSPFLFNMFYKDLVGLLNSKACGITIDGSQFNIYCYADDILISSTTPSGLQELIDTAVNYIKTQGLNFNPTKTSCMVYGRHTFKTDPAWTIQGTTLKVTDGISYLGAGFAKDGGALHTHDRMQAASRAFYSLQHAGLHFKGLNPSVAAHLFSVGVQTTLLYGCEAVHINKTNVRNMMRLQGNHVKAFLGLRRRCHTQPLLHALGIQSITHSLGLRSLNLLRSCLLNSSGATKFYLKIWSDFNRYDMTLLNRCAHFTKQHNVNMLKCILDNNYFCTTKCALHCHDANGLVDSIKELFIDYNDNARYLVHLLVNSF